MDNGSSKEKNGEKKYEVKDKRIFNMEGELKDECLAVSDNKIESGTIETGDKTESEYGKNRNVTTSAERPLPRLDFISFIMSLATAALVHLGEVCHEGGKPEGKNITLARQTIEIIEMLQEKTKGNLARDELKILDDVLFDLRMRFVANTK